MQRYMLNHIDPWVQVIILERTNKTKWFLLPAGTNTDVKKQVFNKNL